MRPEFYEGANKNESEQRTKTGMGEEDETAHE